MSCHRAVMAGEAREAHSGSCWLFPVGGTRGARELASSAQQGVRSLEELPVSQAFVLFFHLPDAVGAADTLQSHGARVGPTPGVWG